MSKKVRSGSTTAAPRAIQVVLGLENAEESLEFEISSPKNPTSVVYVSNLPNFLTVPEFLQQCEPFLPTMTKITICSPKTQQLKVSGSRTSPPGDEGSQYSMFIAFQSPSAAAELQAELHQRPISALAKDDLLVYFVKTNESSDACILPQAVMPHGTPIVQTTSSVGSSQPGFPSQASREREPATPTHQLASTTGDQAANQCSICLDPLSSQPQLTTACAHDFHIACFMQVQDDNCPLCRYNPNQAASSSAARCSDCSNMDDLWMCLVCGAVQCGRYSSGHAIKHYQTTKHAMAVEVGGSRVWDYQRDAFVHRLVSEDQSGVGGGGSGGGEGTTTATGSTAWWALGDEEEAELEAAKLESKTDFIAEFYSQILMHQLQQQQQYFEGQLAALAKQNAFSSLSVEEEAARRDVVSHCIQGYKSIASTFKAQLNHSREKKRGKMKHAKEELDTLAANIESLKEGRVKCEQLLKTMREKNKRSNPQKEEAEKLEAELMELYSKFA